MTVDSKKNSSSCTKWVALLALISCTSLIFLDSTILPVAMPTIKRDLFLTRNLQQWIINAYFLSTATMIFAGGKMADMFGRRRVFCIGMALFAVASALGGFSKTGLELVLCRGLQGIGGALMGPASMALLTEIFPKGERGRAVGILVSVSSIFLSLGPFIGGGLTELFSWRWIFWIHIPIATFGIILALLSLPKSKREFKPFDIPGFISQFLCIACLTLCLMEAKQWNMNSSLVILLFILAVVFFLLFLVISRFSTYPFMDFFLFKNKTFLWGNVLIFCTQLLFMMTVFWPICLQNLMKLTPLKTGILMLPSTLPVLIFAPLAGYISDKFGPKVPTKIGFLLIICSFIWISFFNPQKDSWLFLLPSLTSFGCGISFVMTPIGTVTLSCFSINRNGEASGIYNTVRFSGAAFGIALFGTLMTIIGFIRFDSLLKLNEISSHLNLGDTWEAFETLRLGEIDIASSKAYVTDMLQSILSQSLSFAFTVGNALGALIAYLCLMIVSFRFVPAENMNRISIGHNTKNELNF